MSAAISFLHFNKILRVSASGILGRKAYPDLWPSIVAIIQKKPVHLEASIDVLRAWKIPESVRQLKDFAKSSDTRLQNAFIKLFSSVPMQQQDADLLKHLIKPDIREEQRWPAIAALLPLNNQLAWQQFENLFMAQTQENARGLQMIWINQIQIPCLPASAFITAPNALNSPQHLIWNRNFLSVGNLQQVWNGQTCVAFNNLPVNVQADIKQALRQLYTS